MPSTRNFRNQMRGNIILEAANGAAALINPYVTIPSVVAQGLVNGYSFFSNVRDSYSLTREKVASFSLFAFCTVQLALLGYYFFAGMNCAENDKDNVMCRVGFFIALCKLGVSTFAVGGSEYSKRSFRTEEIIKQRRMMAADSEMQIAPNTQFQQTMLDARSNTLHVVSMPAHAPVYTSTHVPAWP